MKIGQATSSRGGFLCTFLMKAKCIVSCKCSETITDVQRFFSKQGKTLLLNITNKRTTTLQRQQKWWKSNISTIPQSYLVFIHTSMNILDCVVWNHNKSSASLIFKVISCFPYKIRYYFLRFSLVFYNKVYDINSIKKINSTVKYSWAKSNTHF